MPTYSFKCNCCNTEFDVKCKMAEMKQQKCTYCLASDYETVLGTSPLIDPVRLGIKTIDNGFREVLSKIHTKMPKSNLGSKLSR